MNNKARQPISEIAVMILEDIKKQLNALEKAKGKELKKKIADSKEFITNGIYVLELIERINKKYGRKQ